MVFFRRQARSEKIKMSISKMDKTALDAYGETVMGIVLKAYSECAQQDRINILPKAEEMAEQLYNKFRTPDLS